MNFDPLEVLSYLESGFISSPLDRWFTGDSPPSMAPSDVIINPFKNVNSVIETARSYLGKKLPEDQRKEATGAGEASRMDTIDDTDASRASDISVVSSECIRTQSGLST